MTNQTNQVVDFDDLITTEYQMADMWGVSVDFINNYRVFEVALQVNGVTVIGWGTVVADGIDLIEGNLTSLLSTLSVTTAQSITRTITDKAICKSQII
jgi:hypothetical protein